MTIWTLTCPPQQTVTLPQLRLFGHLWHGVVGWTGAGVWGFCEAVIVSSTIARAFGQSTSIKLASRARSEVCLHLWQYFPPLHNLVSDIFCIYESSNVPPDRSFAHDTPQMPLN